MLTCGRSPNVCSQRSSETGAKTLKPELSLKPAPGLSSDHWLQLPNRGASLQDHSPVSIDWRPTVAVNSLFDSLFDSEG